MKNSTTIKLNLDQHEFYKKNGYLILEKVIDSDTVERLKKDADEHARGFYTNYLDMHHVGTFKEIHTGSLLCSIADQICSHRAIPIGGIFFFCQPGNPRERGSIWHQDNTAAKAPYGAYLVLAVALDDADEKNGSLIVIPGSHLLGDLPCITKPNFMLDDQGRQVAIPNGNPCQIPENLPQVQLTYGAGDIVIIHANIIHKAERNTSEDRWRRTMYFVYIKENEPFWPGWLSRRTLLERFDGEEAKAQAMRDAKKIII